MGRKRKTELRRDYSKKDYKNPFFQKKSKKSTRLLFFVVVLIIIFLGIFYFLNNYSYFQIKNIQVSGNITISQQEIEEIIKQQFNKNRFVFLNQNNIFFFSSRQAKKNIFENYFLQDLRIKKNFFDTLEIEVKENTSAVILNSAEKFYCLDLNGLVIKEIKAEDSIIKKTGKTQLVKTLLAEKNLPIIYNLADQSIEVGERVIPEELINFVISITNLISENIDLAIAHFEIDDLASKRVNLVTKEGFKIYFKIDSEPEKQVENLRLILKNKISNRAGLKYIDLRFGERVYWR